MLLGSGSAELRYYKEQGNPGSFRKAIEFAGRDKLLGVRRLATPKGHKGAAPVAFELMTTPRAFEFRLPAALHGQCEEQLAAWLAHFQALSPLKAGGALPA